VHSHIAATDFQIPNLTAWCTWTHRRELSKGVEYGHPRNARKAVSGVARPQDIEGSGMAGLGETLGSPWIPLAVRACTWTDCLLPQRIVCLLWKRPSALTPDFSTGKTLMRFDFETAFSCLSACIGISPCNSHHLWSACSICICS
jgi:hypothetical protein